jgi:hypothetical protein
MACAGLLAREVGEAHQHAPKAAAMASGWGRRGGGGSGGWDKGWAPPA